MKFKNLSGLVILAGMLAVPAICAHAENAALPINNTSFSDVPGYYSTSDASGLSIIDGWLAINNTAATSGEYIDIALNVVDCDRIAFSFEYSSCNSYSASGIDLYVVYGDTETKTEYSIEPMIGGNRENIGYLSGTYDIPENSTELILRLKVNHASQGTTNTPSIKNVRVSSVNVDTTPGVSVVTDNFELMDPSTVTVPEYYEFSTDGNLKIDYDGKTKALVPVMNGNIMNGDGVYVRMTGIEPGSEMNINLSYVNQNGSTLGAIKVFEEIDGVLSSTPVAENIGVTGVQPGTLYGDFTVSDYVDSYRLLIASYAYTGENLSSNGSSVPRFYNINIVPVGYADISYNGNNFDGDDGSKACTYEFDFNVSSAVNAAAAHALKNNTDDETKFSATKESSITIAEGACKIGVVIDGCHTEDIKEVKLVLK